MRPTSLIASVVIAMTGCSSQINDLRPYLPPKDLKRAGNESIASVISNYFTDEAGVALRDIPAVDGPGVSGYAAGVNLWANIASFVSLNGVGRKVILPPEVMTEWGVGMVIHEYIHHLDDMDRDGDGEWIDHEQFLKAYKVMAKDMRYAGIAIWSDGVASSSIVSDLFGIGELSEHIAYVGQILATRGGPDYMKYVFRKILRGHYSSRSTVTTVDGLVVEVVME